MVVLAMAVDELKALLFAATQDNDLGIVFITSFQAESFCFLSYTSATYL